MTTSHSEVPSTGRLSTAPAVDDLRARQLDRLQWTLRDSYESVLFYHRKFDDAGVHPDDCKELADLAKFPTTATWTGWASKTLRSCPPCAAPLRHHHNPERHTCAEDRESSGHRHERRRMNPDPSPQCGHPRSAEESHSRDRATASGFHPQYPGAADPLAAAWYVRVGKNYTDVLFLFPGKQAFAHRYSGDHVDTGPRDRAQLAVGGSPDSVVDAVLAWPRE